MFYIDKLNIYFKIVQVYKKIPQFTRNILRTFSKYKKKMFHFKTLEFKITNNYYVSH